MKSIVLFLALSAIFCAVFARSGKGKCKPGEQYADDCNICTCLDDGKAACTKMLCPPIKKDSIQKCQPGTTWKKDCNWCSCNDAGNIEACTLMACF